MLIKLDHQNTLRIDPTRGGRLLEVRLGGRIVLRGDRETLGSGCYLMYPWVNRIEKMPWADIEPSFTDDNKLPLHGMFVNEARTVEITVPAPGSLAITMRPIKQMEGVPSFT
jgi:galactose mutarotase-like enzyme